MSKLFFLLFLFSDFGFSQDSTHCYSSLDILGPIHQKNLTDWGATIDQIQKASCLKENIAAPHEMKKFLQRHPSTQTVNKTISGIHFKNESPHLLKLAEELLKTHDKKNLTISSTCQKVECALDEIFGEGVGLKYLYTLDKHGMNLSHHTHPDRSPWKKKDVDLIIKTLDEFPESLMPYAKHQHMNHFLEGYILDEEGVSDSTLAFAQPRHFTRTLGPHKHEHSMNTMTFFDKWDRENPEYQKYTIIHEMAHSIGDQLKLDTHPDWLKISGWEEKEDNWSYDKSSPTFVSKYAKESPFEDFAESFSTYRYNPEGLKETSPEKYNFIKKYVFHGVEFTSEDKCQAKESLGHQLLKNFSPSPLDPANKFKQCEEEIIPLLTSNSIFSDLEKCLHRQKFHNTLKTQIENRPEINADPTLVKSLTSVGLNHFEQFPEYKPSKEEMKKSLVHFYETIMNDFVQKTNTYSNLRCSDPKLPTDGYLIFKESLFSLTQNGFIYNDNKAELNKITQELCNLVPAPKVKVTCADIVPYFQKLIPTELKDVQLPKKIGVSGCQI